MFQWSRRPRTASDPLPDEHVLEWRAAAQSVRRTYNAWCAAGRRDRQRLYQSFLDALVREEQAALQVERDVASVGLPNAVS